SRKSRGVHDQFSLRREAEVGGVIQSISLFSICAEGACLASWSKDADAVASLLPSNAAGGRLSSDTTFADSGSLCSTGECGRGGSSVSASRSLSESDVVLCDSSSLEE